MPDEECSDEQMEREQFTWRNHSIPAGYLKGWSEQPSRVQAYRLLVPDDRYPLWEPRAIRGLTVYPHLYTSVATGSDSDDFEVWLKEEIETPATEALDRVRRDLPLDVVQWNRLVRYVAALDLRTPATYAEHTARWEREMPVMINRTIQRAKAELRRRSKARAKGKPIQDDPKSEPERSTPDFPVRVRLHDAPRGGAILSAEVTMGRELWLQSMRQLLTSTVSVLQQHSWQIMTPYKDSEWFTSDHPVIRLSYRDEQEYDFRGGWGRPNVEIMAPLSPRHLLYAKVGERQPTLTRALDREQTLTIQRFLAKRAHRWIIAKRPDVRAAAFAPRKVDREAFAAEEKAWQAWHETQRAAEEPAKFEDMRPAT